MQLFELNIDDLEKELNFPSCIGRIKLNTFIVEEKYGYLSPNKYLIVQEKDCDFSDIR
jgi:hypothetical protein